MKKLNLKKVAKIVTLILCIMTVNPLCVNAETLSVIQNSNSGISRAYYTGTLSDGSVLGFYDYSSNGWCFCGAITNATSLEVPDSVEYNGKTYPITRCGYYEIDFDEAASLTSLTLPETITTINGVLPKQIKDLYLKSANPPSLYESSSSIPITTTVWVPEAAYNTYKSSWTNRIIHYEGWIPNKITVDVKTAGTFAQLLLDQIDQWSDVDELTVSGSMNDTDLGYLSRLKNVMRIDLSQTDLKTIKGCAGLTLLRRIILPETIETVQDKAFNGCSSLDSISLPAATSIGSYAFYYCDALTSVSLPAATSIGSSALSFCSSLTSVSLPAATSIGYQAFSSCSSLTSVSLPAATSIGYQAFYYCKSLTSVSLPATLKFIDSYAFNGCSALKDVYCYLVSPLTTTAFKSTGAPNTTLHVPAFSVNAYILHDDWYTFNKIVPIDDDLDNVVINSDFTVTGLKGLAEKADLSLQAESSSAAHLTVAADSIWSIGDFDCYAGGTTMVAYSEMTADNVTVTYPAKNKKWNFVSFPFDVKVSDISCPEGTLWVVRKYSGEDRANMTGNTWQNMTSDMTLKAGEGYILHCTNESYSSGSTIDFTLNAVNNNNKNNIFAYQDVEKPLSSYTSEYAHNSGWNLVGNPYPCYLNSKTIDHDGVITVWNGNGYTAYSLVDDSYVLSPFEAFFVQCADDATGMTFNADGRGHSSKSEDYQTETRARNAMGSSSRNVYNLLLSNGEYTDKARVVINENAKMDYEISCDASKFMSSDIAVPQLYVIENSQKLSIDERPLSEGVISLGAYFGQSGNYSISLSANADENISVKLYDSKTGTVTDIAQDEYVFTASEGTDDSRFTISFINTPSGIADLSVMKQNDMNAVYNSNGQRLSAPQRGINIINGVKVISK